MLTEIEILHQLQQIDSGDVWVYYDGNPEWFDDVVYKCTNGWTINANIRRGAFNYIDQITTPDGRTADFDQIAKGMPERLQRAGIRRMRITGVLSGQSRSTGRCISRKTRQRRGWSAR